ncbi:hypothetical protein HY627_02260 [Candidatus Uhrbacteria bacterium]|nr:hypothetical protein [Candidatus Uhrbacteria bacterium]
MAVKAVKILFFGIVLSYCVSATIAEGKSVGKDGSYRGKVLIVSSDAVTMAADERMPFEVGFKNTGTKPWLPSGRDAVLLRSKVTRESYFYDAPSWLSRVRVVPVPDRVQVGEVTYVTFVLHAPVTPGIYSEEMYLERGGAEIPGSRFAIPISVSARPAAGGLSAPLANVIEQPKPAIGGTMLATLRPVQGRSEELARASKLIQSDTALSMPALGQVAFEIGYKNSGTAAWPDAGDTALALRSSAKKESWFYDPTWQTGNVVKRVGAGAVGELVYVNFILNAPSAPGRYVEKLALFSGAKKISGTDVFIPITVTPYVSRATLASAPVTPSAPSPAIVQTASTSSEAIAPSGIINDIRDTEKLIRVGVTHSNDPIHVTASKDYEVRDTAGTLLGTQISGGVTTVVYDRGTKLYSVTMQNANATSTLPIRMSGIHSTTTAPDRDTIFEILSYSNRPKWSTTINDNTFRGALEVNYASKTDRVWVINTLTLEDYLRGTGETSNSSPYEFQKALMIAARTYGLYHIQRSTKNAADNFTVRATDADQVYRGYAAELRLPNVARAITETRGVIVMHEGSLVITPYYSQSDGRTRAWSEVWGGGPYPWLLSVPDPGNAGLPMLGHGVGMSARGALLMALEGKRFDEILKYYYTGIELRRVYQ